MFIDLMNIDLIISVEIYFSSFFITIIVYSIQVCQLIKWMAVISSGLDLSYLKVLMNRFVCLSHWHDVFFSFYVAFCLSIRFCYTLCNVSVLYSIFKRWQLQFTLWFQINQISCATYFRVFFDWWLNIFHWA